MSENIQQNAQFPEWIIVNTQKLDRFPIWIIATAIKEMTLTAFNYEVKVHLNQRFWMYLKGNELIHRLENE